jgi:hypothetical protein
MAKGAVELLVWHKVVDGGSARLRSSWVSKSRADRPCWQQIRHINIRIDSRAAPPAPARAQFVQIVHRLQQRPATGHSARRPVTARNWDSLPIMAAVPFRIASLDRFPEAGKPFAQFAEFQFSQAAAQFCELCEYCAKSAR